MTANRSVVVTGASTGIGWGTVKVLVARGFQVFGTVRKQNNADRLANEFGAAFTPLLMDVTDHAAVARAAEQVGASLGHRRLAGLVNNAGIAMPGPLLHLPLEEYRRQLEVNLIAPLALIQAFAPLLGTDRGREAAPEGRGRGGLSSSHRGQAQRTICGRRQKVPGLVSAPAVAETNGRSADRPANWTVGGKRLKPGLLERAYFKNFDRLRPRKLNRHTADPILSCKSAKIFVADH